MTDWMNDLENELAGLAPKPGSRDLIAAALCAHRDSEVLTAKRLSRELTADELETAFSALDDKYPGLISENATAGTSMAIAFVRTPTEPTIAERPTSAKTSESNTNWISKLTMVAALLLCFAGGIGIGLRSGTGTENAVAKSKPVNAEEPASEPTTPVAVAKNDVQAEEPLPEVIAPRRSVRRVPYGRPKSSLTDLAREYHRQRHIAGIQASL